MLSFDKRVVTAALKRLGMPYIWGGHGNVCWVLENSVAKIVPMQAHAGCPFGYDCAGLVTDAVLEAGGPDIRWKHNAQTLYDTLPIILSPIPDDNFLVFYGRPGHISHIAIGLGKDLIIEAAGGDQTTNTYADALNRGATVRINYEHRLDRMGFRKLMDVQDLT